MPFEFLFDGYVRRFTVLAPPDWMSVIELTGESLPLFVFAWPGRVADFEVPDGMGGLTILEQGSPKASGAYFALRPSPAAPEWALDPTAADPQWPKYIALFVEGIDPTGEESRSYRNLSGDLEPHDLGTFEWMYTDGDTHRQGDVELLKVLVDTTSNQLDETWDTWYAGIKTRLVPVVDPEKVYLVGAFQGATFVLEALADPKFHGAALIVGPTGGTFGGDKVASPDVVGREVRPPNPPPDPKAIFAICGSAEHLGDVADDARTDVPHPSPFSLVDLQENGDRPFEESNGGSLALAGAPSSRFGATITST